MHRAYAHVRTALFIDWLLLSQLGRAMWDRIDTTCGHIGR